MSSGLSNRQQLFCDVYLDNGCKNASEAYRAAYGNDKSEANINTMASRLLRTVKIREHIIKVQTKNLEKTERKQDISRDFLIGQYLDLVRLVKENKQISAARQALDSLAHVTGLWLDRKSIEVSGTVDHSLTAYDSHALMEALQQAKRDTKAIEGNFREISAGDQPTA